MNTKLTALERAILVGACEDLKYLRTTRRKLAWNQDTLREAIEDARKGGMVLLETEIWTNMALDTAAKRMAASRAYASLEMKGLVERVFGWSENRTSHLRPTKKGIGLVAALPKEGRAEEIKPK